MSGITKCRVCLAPNQDEIEAVGLRAVNGELSWRAAAREADMGEAYASLRNHMQQHYTERELREVEDEMETAIDEAVAELYASMRAAPAEVKPLYVAAIRNLQGLKETKPSQQHLIQALKTIQEMTGMKQEQRWLAQFAQAMFREVPQPPAPKSLAQAVLDVEAVDA